MKLIHKSLPAILLAGLTTSLPAQGEEGRGHRPPPPPIIGALDKNHDGVISKRELNHAPRALAKLDENKDGQLTRDELRPAPPIGQDERPPRDKKEEGDRPEGKPMGPPPIVRALDADDDGVISKEEIENSSESLATLDKNEDGELTREELHPPRPDGEADDRPNGPPPGGDRRGERRGPPPGGPGGGPPPRR